MVESGRRRKEKELMGVFLLGLCLCILSLLTPIHGATDPSDASALWNMYFSLNNAPQLTNWKQNSGDPCGESWKGITCSGSRVTQIKLPGLGLSGSIGLQLGSLTSLTELDVSNNNFVGQIPYCLPPNVQRLNLANNNFSPDIPYSISLMTSLKYLNLGHNQLQNQLYDMFSQLTSLTTLDLSFNSLSGSLPRSFSSLSSMTTMYLQNNQFSGDINALANLPLDTLNIANNHFTGWIPEQLKGISLQKDGNSFTSGLAPPPPPGTPPDTMMKEIHSKEKTVEDVMEVLKHVPIHPRVVPAIKTAHALGCDLRVVSDANLFFIETILNHLEIRECFSEINTNPGYVDEEGRLRISPHHDFHKSPHGCPLCPPNMCKGEVVERIRGGPVSNKKFIYLGDGSGDYCPTLKLGDGDYVMPRKDFPVWDLICKNPLLIKAEIHEWSNGEELEQTLLQLIARIMRGEEESSNSCLVSLSGDCKFQTIYVVAYPPFLPVPQ